MSSHVELEARHNEPDDH